MSIDLRDELRAKYGTSETARFFSAGDRRKHAKSGKAMSDGSFPILNAEDLKSAIGLAHTPAQRAHVKKRAAALGLSERIPDSWKSENAEVEPERAFVVRGTSGRTVITAPMREVAQVNPGFTYLRGRFVEADTPNRNNAMWTTEDLQLGAPTVAGGPLNWLHEETKVIGTLLDGTLVSGHEAAAEGDIGNHIVSNAVIWKFLYPNEAGAVEYASAQGEAYFSMECIAREVMCVDTPGRPGCGESFSYADADAGKTCGHLRDRSSVRRLVDPLFLGGAILVPPVRPGWANADVEVMRDAAEVVDLSGLTDAMARKSAEAMVVQVMNWANR